MARGPTINDVARLAGVSNMTVSRVLNRAGGMGAEPAGAVAEATRRRVEEAARALGYEPNLLAQAMRTDTTRAVGFFLPDITNATNATVAQAAERALSRAGYRLVLASTGFSVAREAELLRSFRRRTVDGVIAVLADETAPAIHALLRDSPVPVVVIDRDLPFAVDTVWSDHEAAMREVVRHLVGLGHRRIGLIMSPITMRPGRRRVEAFAQAMREAGVEPDLSLVCWARQLAEDGHRATLELLRRPDRPSALVVGANQQTFGALLAIRELGLSIPGDISFVGADESLATSLVEPPLTVIWRDMEQVGAAAAALLLERLARPPRREVRTVTLPSQVILRRSCGPPAQVRRGGAGGP